MVREEIVLGHHISSEGLQVDRAKVVAIERLPPPTSEKGIRSFLAMLGFSVGLLRISLNFQSIYLIYLKKMFHFILMMIVWLLLGL